MSSDTSSTGNGPTFSLREARNIVRDLFEPNEKIYWTDFLLSIFGGYASSALVRLIGEWMPEPEQLPLSLALRGLAFAVSCCLLFRSVLFIHEIVHLPEKKFRAFRFAWNLLCGIPFLTPSFTYYPHLDHHRRRTFGTHEDGEYLPLARMSPWVTCVYLFQGLIGPPWPLFDLESFRPLLGLAPSSARLFTVTFRLL
ncbi:MAG: fatty acid desaturase [Pirellulales bacterium]